MKFAILSFSLIAYGAQAEVFKCPAVHQGARLIGAGMHEGRQKEAELMGASRKVPGGIDADFGFKHGDVKWLACQYEPKTVRWYRVSLAATRCELRQRGDAPGKVAATVRCN
ncbi:STY0301 family protein [Massilia sp. MS-15]|uniref:STY0301 family protein n=1 Tax=Massilia sp. MS-15 TaxID=2878200 RepID=UPI001CD3B8A6|nr:STY0301 family protein [Massilia sp. MS-15]MCA1246983.1 hypothetical protein [Massilia sp. MS-15]